MKFKFIPEDNYTANEITHLQNYLNCAPTEWDYQIIDLYN